MSFNRKQLRAHWAAWMANDMELAGPWWLQLGYALLFSAGLALLFTVLGMALYGGSGNAWLNPARWLYWYGQNLTVSVTIGVIIFLLFFAGGHLMGARRMRAMQGWQRSLYFAGLPLLGVALGWPLGVLLTHAGSLPSWLTGERAANNIATAVVISLVMSYLFHVYFSARSRQHLAEKRAAEAQLRLLQAQMEPHFLFNTLANVQSLIEHEPAKARLMLETFTDYLRATLGQLRSEQSTVGAELDLARSYLQLLQLRMEDRLSFDIQADEAARAAPLPPLCLQPLVENAIHHGLEPKVEGGRISLHARLAGTVLTLQVQDTGLGLQAPPRRRTSNQHQAGAGMALANLRERLLARYGEAATLELTDTQPGTRALITLPVH
jgi:hypothetical protein